LAIPKKGSRKIIVNEIAFRWLIRRKTIYSKLDYGIGKLHVAVELFEQPKSTLIIYSDRPHPHNVGRPKVIPITPSDIQKWIQEALILKWDPYKSGPQFYTNIEDGKMKIKK